jgi:CheY-like chemotaxis protein
MNYRNILLVHRASEPLKRLSRTLENVGHKVKVASSAAEALQLIAEETPQIIIASDDIQEPDVYEFCQHIKDLNINGMQLMLVVKKVKIKLKEKATECGADDCVPESCTLPFLVERVNELLYKGRDTSKDLTGSLTQSGLIDILQLLEFSAKSGILTVKSGDLSGSMIFSEGHLVDACTEENREEAAVYEMLSWGKGEFYFEAKGIAGGKPMLASLSSLVLEWARASDEGDTLPITPPETYDEKEMPQNWASSLNAWLGYLKEQ